MLSLTSETRHIFVSSCVCKRCLICADFSPDSDQNTFTGGRVIMDYGLLFRKEAMFKLSFSLHKTLTDGLEWCGLLWCFYQLFGLSFWRHPFTAEHWTFLQTWWRNKLVYISDGLRVSTFSGNWHILVIYSFKKVQ